MEELLRDFLVFWMNHRDSEKLFRHGYFFDHVSTMYGTRPTVMKDFQSLMLAHSPALFVDMLRLCRMHVMSKEAKLDLLELINYAKEALPL